MTPATCCATTLVTFNLHTAPIASARTTFSDSWAVRDAAEQEQNKAGESSRFGDGLRESFARTETAHTLLLSPLAPSPS